MPVVYHFLPSEFGIDDLRKRRVKIARLNEVNDPFELFSVQLDDRRQREIFKRHKASMSKKYGLLCFAPDWSSPPMWTHYAENHAGFAFGFDIAATVLNQVKYYKRRIRVTADQIARMAEADGKQQMLELLTSKSDHWSYERELRCFPKLNQIDTEFDMYFKSFDDDDINLREVILGYKCKARFAEISELVEGWIPQVSIRRARPAFTKYEMVEQKNDQFC